jgi:hypothetical protein
MKILESQLESTNIIHRLIEPEESYLLVDIFAHHIVQKSKKWENLWLETNILVSFFSIARSRSLHDGL